MCEIPPLFGSMGFSYCRTYRRESNTVEIPVTYVFGSLSDSDVHESTSDCINLRGSESAKTHVIFGEPHASEEIHTATRRLVALAQISEVDTEKQPPATVSNDLHQLPFELPSPDSMPPP